MIENLFIYGTLGPGRPNEHILAGIGGTWDSGAITGFLRDKGWGAEMGYPGIVLDSSGDKVSCFVFTSEKLNNHWNMLDDFEGDAYKRVVTTAELEDGRIIDVNVYALKDSV